MSGLGAGATQAIGSAIIADIFPESQRGNAVTLWMLGPILGPSYAPVITGFVSQTIGWRWVNWTGFILMSLCVFFMLFFQKETNHRVLIRHKVDRLREELNFPDLRSCYIDPHEPILTKRQILLDGLTHPLAMLFLSPVIFSISLYFAFAHGCLYLLYNTIPIVFQGSYHWPLGITGLVYLALFIGHIIGLVAYSILSEKAIIQMTVANGWVFEPEMKLRYCIWSACLLPINFFWYSWSADKVAHWAVPVVGLLPFGVAIVGIWLPMQSYVADAYPQHAASGLAVFSVLQSMVAAFLPLAGPQMNVSLGVGWASSLLGFIALALVPIPVLVYKYGTQVRKRFPINF